MGRSINALTFDFDQSQYHSSAVVLEVTAADYCPGAKEPFDGTPLRLRYFKDGKPLIAETPTNPLPVPDFIEYQETSKCLQPAVDKFLSVLIFGTPGGTDYASFRVKEMPKEDWVGPDGAFKLWLHKDGTEFHWAAWDETYSVKYEGDMAI